MKQVHIKTCGMMAFWNAKPCNVGVFRNAMLPLGLDQYVPEPRTDRSAMENALKEYGESVVKPGRDVLVLSLEKPGTNGFELREVWRGSVANQPDYVCSAKSNHGYVLVTGGSADRIALQNLYDKFKAELTSEAVGKFLVDIAVTHLRGNSPKKNGGLYWIPEARALEWVTIAEEVERVTGSLVVTGHFEASPSVVTALTDQTSDDVQRACQQILEDIQDGKPHSDEYFAARAKMAVEQLKRVEEVEQALSVNLLACRASLELVQNVLMATTIV